MASRRDLSCPVLDSSNLRAILLQARHVHRAATGPEQCNCIIITAHSGLRLRRPCLPVALGVTVVPGLFENENLKAWCAHL
jgi:hypothetical protein